MDLRFGYESGAGRPFGAVWDSFICHVADMQPASCFYILKFLYMVWCSTLITKICFFFYKNKSRLNIFFEFVRFSR